MAGLMAGLAQTGATTLSWIGRQRHPAWRTLFDLLTRLHGRIGASAFARGTSVMLIGTLLGQASSVLLSPLLTRLYTPDQFGALGVYMSIISIAAVVGSLCYEIAIPTARTAIEAGDMLCLCVVSLMLTTGLLAVASWLFPAPALAQLGLGALDDVRVLVPIGFALLAAYHLILYFAIWAHDFDAIARTRIGQGLSGPLSQIVLGLSDFGAVGLCVGFVIGQSSGTVLLVYRMVVQRWDSLRGVSLRGMLRVAWQRRAFPLISSWAMTIDTAGNGQLAYILVALLYPGPLAGFMFISERVVGRPLLMLSTSLLSVYMAEAGQTATADPAQLRRRFRQVASRQALLGGLWVLVVDVGAVLLFPLLFGADWADAVPYLLVLSLAYLIVNVVVSVGHTLQILGRQGIAAFWQVGRVLAVSAGFLLSAHVRATPLHAIVLYAGVQVAACAALLLIMQSCIETTVAPSELRTA